MNEKKENSGGAWKSIVEVYENGSEWHGVVREELLGETWEWQVFSRDGEEVAAGQAKTKKEARSSVTKTIRHYIKNRCL